VRPAPRRIGRAAVVAMGSAVDPPRRRGGSGGASGGVAAQHGTAAARRSTKTIRPRARPVHPGCAEHRAVRDTRGRWRQDRQ
jgi:hypothetical protein